MRLLLDTHVAIWVLTEPHRVPSTVSEEIANPANLVSVSAAAIWEIAIKHPLERPDSPPFSGSEAIGHFQTAGFSVLEVSAAHAAFVERLPLIHSDPFDRLMLAQALIEGMQFVTHDRRLSRYAVPVLSWT